jgi:lipoprotein signal peptidase
MKLPLFRHFLFFVVTFLVLVDQASKFLVLTYRFFPVYYNDTVAFSLPIPWFLPWLIFIVCISGYYIFKRTEFIAHIHAVELYLSRSLLLCCAVGLVVGGALSNLLDRALHSGLVIDFIRIPWWPVFNLADSAIVCGVLLIVYYMYITER